MRGSRSARAGGGKLDDRNDDATTNLLAISAMAKGAGRTVSVHEEARGGRNYITEMYDIENSWVGPTLDISFSVSECVYGWTAAYQQRGTAITVRIRLNPDRDVTAAEMATLRTTWRTGIENKWSNRFGCCSGSDCSGQCALQFRVEWVTSGQHHSCASAAAPAAATWGCGTRPIAAMWHRMSSAICLATRTNTPIPPVRAGARSIPAMSWTTPPRWSSAFASHSATGMARMPSRSDEEACHGD